jgi:hypothetical protein
VKDLFFCRLQTQITYEISSFEEQLRHLRAADYPTDVPKRLIDDLLSELNGQKQILQEIAADFENDSRGAGDRLQSEHRKITYRFAEYTTAIENAQTQRVPWGFVPGIESLANVMNPGHALITSSTDVFTYSIRYRPRPATGGADSFNALSVPALHRFDSLLHVLVGHELFHPLLSSFFDAQQPAVLDRLRVACQPLVTSAASLPGKETIRLDQWVEFARDVWVRAMEELMCDMGCAAVFGPAGLLATWSFAIGRNLDQLPQAKYRLYPPWRYRVRTMIRHPLDDPTGVDARNTLMERLESDLLLRPIAQQFRRYWDTITEAVAVEDDINAINRIDVLRIAYNEVASSLSPAWDFVSALVNRCQVSWTRTYEEIPKLLTLLKAQVPPSEIRSADQLCGSAASLSSIASAAWLYQLSCEGTGVGSVDVSQYERSCRLMLKAFDDAELKRQYLEFRR